MKRCRAALPGLQHPPPSRQNHDAAGELSLYAWPHA